MWITVILSGVSLAALVMIYLALQKKLKQVAESQQKTETQLQAQQQAQVQSQQQLHRSHDLQTRIDTQLHALLSQNQQQQKDLASNHQQTSKLLQDTIIAQTRENRDQVSVALKQYAQAMGQQFEQLTNSTQMRLKSIGEQVDKNLQDGFAKTTTTFQDVLKRLTLIDVAQKKITELSGHVVDLQSILIDHRSRGAFGEVQLAQLISNMIPPGHFSLQHTLSNGKRVDCLLRLPAPSGNVSIDAKFPLETFRQLTKNPDPSTLNVLKRQFRQDMKVHIKAISEKYIIPNETADGAVMFIPAEAVFAEIHANFPDIVDLAHQARVWIASPTTMMAILTTAKAVLKDEATKQQVHLIQQHLTALSKDFSRFQKRMDSLSRHIQQANQDVENVQVSSQKIASRFAKIEKVELHQEQPKIQPEKSNLEA